MACHESIWVNSVSRLCLAANFSYAGWTCNGSYELASRYKASSQNSHFASRPVLNSFVTPYISSDYLPLSVTHSHSYCLFSNFFFIFVLITSITPSLVFLLKASRLQTKSNYAFLHPISVYLRYRIYPCNSFSKV